MTKATEAKHDFNNGDFSLFDENGNEVYFESSDGWWYKRGYDKNNNLVYYESSSGWWEKSSSGWWENRGCDENGEE